VCVYGASVSAAWTDVFYIEKDNRSCGMRVQKTSHGIAAGNRVNIGGLIGTNSDGERYIDASYVYKAGSGSIKPVGVKNLAVGGGDFAYDVGPPKTGQQGILGGAGLNNMGLLVETWGRVTQIGAGYLYINDGADLNDGTFTGVDENVGLRVICDPTGYAPGQFVTVRCVSSCFKIPSGDLARRMLTRTPSDITKL
jgi:hypothetical protein